jgi:hypothetical protein
MSEEPPRFRPLVVFEVLARHRVDYVLIGGLAATLAGSPLTTGDVDICPDRSSDNLVRLTAALRELRARVHAADSPRGIPFNFAPETLAHVEIWNLVTDGGRLDIAWVPAGTRGFPDLIREAVTYDVDGIAVRAASLADVIRSKEAAGRERDRAALPTLRLLLERLERGGD